MKDLKHTKGEWKQEHRVVDEEGMYSTEVFSGNTVICTMHWAGERIGNITYSRSKENAKLIAAAPKMYEELSEIIEYINKMGVVSIAMQVIKNKAKEALKSTE